MKPNKQMSFGPFSLDEANQCVWRDEKAIPLRPKPYAVLKYLIDHAGTLVTKDQLLQSVWPDTFVGDAVLKDCIRQLRDVLEDDPKSPKFIETVHRRGYRFIAAVVEKATPAPSRPVNSYEPHEPVLPETEVLDRDEALSQLSGWLDRALNSERQIVFVTGEAGIGKTTLVEAFLKRTAQLHNIWIAKGQCLEQYGAGEAYLPVLDCFSSLGSALHGERIVGHMRANAPNWLAQMPRLFFRSECEDFRENFGGVTRDRMLREMAELIEAITAETPMVLVLEDLHWSDYSTLDLISYLARRRDSSRLLIIGTYRPVEVVLSDHPLKHVKLELQMHKLCHELPLEYLSPAAVAEFLRRKFSTHDFPDNFSPLIHQRTEGNPLFMINVIEYLLDEQIIVETGGTWHVRANLQDTELEVPENIRNLIEKHFERLSPDEQRVLEGASVVGMDCSAVAIGAGLAEDIVTIEQICDNLARRDHFLLPPYLATLPDGTITPRYRFIHALYLDVLYHRVPSTRRSQIHGRIGRSGEAIYGEQVGEIAAELAVHFEQARDNARAVKYLRMAAENAARRSADHEALNHARRGLQLLELLPASREFEEHRVALLGRLSQSTSPAV
jgi:predicted ATPase/DNA-binding winged helix-turn-helix (wHTH) protein